MVEADQVVAGETVRILRAELNGIAQEAAVYGALLDRLTERQAAPRRQDATGRTAQDNRHGRDRRRDSRDRDAPSRPASATTSPDRTTRRTRASPRAAKAKTS